MTALKNKLAEKVEIINKVNSFKENISLNESSSINESDRDNLIILNPSQNNQIAAVVPEFAISLNEAKQRIATLQGFIKEMMIPNVDYGLIPKCDKPTLFKPGAEKLCDIFGFSKQIEISNRIEDWDKGLFHYEVKAILINKRTGFTESEGIGCCNNMERKYKNQDGYNIVNTILKMAKKRAFIDAVLSATRSSGIFTQDIEDYQDDTTSNNTDSKIVNSFHTNIKSNNSSHSSTPISKSQQAQIFSLIVKRDLPIDTIKSIMQKKYKVNESKSFTSDQANEFFEFLKSYNQM